MLLIITLIAVFSLSWLLTYAAKRYALQRSLLDIPNERSSHTVPTPRGGGVAIAGAFFIGVGILCWADIIPAALAAALASGGVIIALIGYLDDRYSIAVRWRLLAQFAGAAAAIYCLQTEQLLLMNNWSVIVNLMGNLILVLMIVWLINIYNFMDGIDGLAGAEAVFVSLSAGCLLLVTGHNAATCWVLAAAAAGFLYWNWPPAKIFMGDVSSGLLGFIFAVLMIYTAGHQQLPMVTWWILLAVFIADTGLTLIWRTWRGEKLYVAHRGHAYQQLVQQGKSHLQVTAAISGFNLLVAAPLAYLSLYHFTWSIYSCILLAIISCLVWKIINKG